MGLLLDMSQEALRKGIVFTSYVVIDPGSDSAVRNRSLSEREYRDSLESSEITSRPEWELSL